MTEFTEELRHYCRNPRCRSKLPAPVNNSRGAFCTRGCHVSFYLKRCLVCEGPIERKAGNQKVCRKSQCRSALRAGIGLGRYYPTSDVKLPSKSADFIGPEQPLNPDRPTLIRNAIQTEFFGGGQWRTVVSPDGVVCHVNRLWDGHGNA